MSAHVASYFDAVLVENCFGRGSCSSYWPYLHALKPVFNVEYFTARCSFCPQAAQVPGLNSLKTSWHKDWPDAEELAAASSTCFADCASGAWSSSPCDEVLAAAAGVKTTAALAGASVDAVSLLMNWLTVGPFYSTLLANNVSDECPGSPGWFPPAASLSLHVRPQPALDKWANVSAARQHEQGVNRAAAEPLQKQEAFVKSIGIDFLSSSLPLASVAARDSRFLIVTIQRAKGEKLTTSLHELTRLILGAYSVPFCDCLLIDPRGECQRTDEFGVTCGAADAPFLPLAEGGAPFAALVFPSGGDYRAVVDADGYLWAYQRRHSLRAVILSDEAPTVLHFGLSITSCDGAAAEFGSYLSLTEAAREWAARAWQVVGCGATGGGVAGGCVERGLGWRGVAWSRDFWGFTSRISSVLLAYLVGGVRSLCKWIGARCAGPRHFKSLFDQPSRSLRVSGPRYYH